MQYLGVLGPQLLHQKMRFTFLIMFLIYLNSCSQFEQGQFSHLSENEFKANLSGSWVLKSYQDSVSKGHTPFGLQDLLSNTHGFFYKPDEIYSHNFPEDSSYWIYINSKKNFLQQGLAFEYKKNGSNIIKKKISHKYDTNIHKFIDILMEPELIGSFKLSKLRDALTLNLVIENDSVSMVKGNYQRLIIQEFIAGEYTYNDSILVTFDTNGIVHNLDSVDDSFQDIESFDICLGYFMEESDCISFRNPNNKIDMFFNWTKSGSMFNLESSLDNSIRFQLIENTP